MAGLFHDDGAMRNQANAALVYQPTVQQPNHHSHYPSVQTSMSQYARYSHSSSMYSYSPMVQPTNTTQAYRYSPVSSAYSYAPMPQQPSISQANQYLPESPMYSY